MNNLNLSQYSTESKDELKKAKDRIIKKGGRKPKEKDDLFVERVASTLTIKQKEDWIEALDGRAEATTLRRLILEFIDKQKS